MSSVLGDDGPPGPGQGVRAPGLLGHGVRLPGVLDAAVQVDGEDPLGLGQSPEQVYNQAVTIPVAMRVIGLVCHQLVRARAGRAFMADAGLAEGRQLAHRKAMAAQAGPRTETTPTLDLVLARPARGIPSARGAHGTPVTAANFFT